MPSAPAWFRLLRERSQSSHLRRTAMNHSTASARPASTGLPRSETDTRLYGSWLVLTRLVCLALCVSSVGFYVAGVLSYIAHDYLFCSGPVAACHTYGTVVVPPNQVSGLSREAVG